MENKVEVRPERARFVRESADFRRQALIEATEIGGSFANPPISGGRP